MTIQLVIDEYSFERMKMMDDECEFDDYEHFLTHNKECVENLSIKECDFLIYLCEKIINKEILTTDEEDFGEWSASGIYFNIDKKLVIMHPR